MKRWPEIPLNRVAEVKAGFAWKSDSFSNNREAGPAVVRIQNLGANDNAVLAYYTGPIEPGYWVEKEDLLVSLSGSFKACQWDGPRALLNQRIVVIRPCHQLNRRFAFYQISQRLHEISQAAVGIAVANASMGTVRDMHISVPPVPEQERIVKLLDEADELRKLRSQADTRTAQLIPALFHEMFGDPETNHKRWPVFHFRELLAEPLRNGLSPAKDGSHPAKVLTLSAITGERFDSTECKNGSFARRPDLSCQAFERLFLICRGNGNREFVGRAKFARGSEEGMVFPDTMIAGVPKAELLLPSFLEAAWNHPFTRAQICSGARTTNGTYKINQTAIENIRLLVPPLSLQAEFAKRVTEILGLETAQTTSRRRTQDLFQSMLHKAFNGEL